MTQSPPQKLNTSEYGSRERAPGATQASDTVSEVMDQAQNTARQVSAQAKQGATSRLESQKERAVDSLVTVAQALRQTGQHLQEQDQGTIGTYIELAAERVEDFTNHLRANDVSGLLAESQDFARRRPTVFLGAALALGFVGARFLMSSGQRASDTNRALPEPWTSSSSNDSRRASAPAFQTPTPAHDSPEQTRPPMADGMAGPTSTSGS
jgi:hypothetical protein